MAPKNKARQKPGSMKSRQQAKLNSQKAQKAPIEPSNRVGPRRQLPPSSEGGRRVGNSSQPWGEQQRSGNEVREVKVREVRPQLPGTAPKVEKPAPKKALPAAGESSANKPSGVQNPSTSRRPPSRREMAEDKLRRAAQGSKPSDVRIARGRGTSRLTPEGMFAGPRVGPGVNKALAIANLAMMAKDMAEKGADPKFWEQKSKEIKQRAAKDKAKKAGTVSFDEKAYASQQKFPVPKTAEKKPAEVTTASQQPTTFTNAPRGGSKPAPKASTKPSSAQTGNKEADMSTWAKANRKMIEKVGTKSQREILAKALGGSNTANDQLKVKPTETKTDSSTAANSSMDKNKTSIEGDKKAQAFTQKMTAEERRKRERMAQARLNGNA